LIKLDFSGRFLGAGEHPADHHAVRAGGDRLADVARIADAAVGDQAHLAALERLGDHIDGRDLRHADTGDDARRADRPRADADLDRVRAGVDQRARASPVTMLPAISDRSGKFRCTQRTRSMTPCECPCAESITMASTPASTSA
jgi:hypothetical protein